MRGSIPQGDPDALMTKERNSRARNRDGWPFRSVLDPAGAPQSPDRSLRARRKFPPCVSAGTPPKLLYFWIKRPITEIKSRATQVWLILDSFDLSVDTSCPRGVLTN